MDPKNPGAVDEIIDLGRYRNDCEIKKHREKIIDTSQNISEYFARAYRYLASAKNIYDDENEIYKKAITENVHEGFIENIMFQEFGEIPICDYSGNERKLFASAITPKGIINRLDTIFDKYKVYTIKGYAGDVLNNISRNALLRGLDVEKYYCPFEPDKKCEHLLIPKLNVAFTCHNEYHGYDGDETVDFLEFSDKNILDKYTDILDYDRQTVKELTNKAIDCIKCAKSFHDELEKFYIQNMDFGGIDKEFERVMCEISKKRK